MGAGPVFQHGLPGCESPQSGDTLKSDGGTSTGERRRSEMIAGDDVVRASSAAKRNNSVDALPEAEAAADLTAEQRERAARVTRLLEAWMADESGHDEETWPRLREVLDGDRLSFRKLFS